MTARSVTALLAAVALFQGARAAEPRLERLTVADSEITEASGLAASSAADGFLWTLNDSGGKPIIYAVGADGAVLARVKIRDVKNRDWEAMAAFSLDGEPRLLVADTGDNLGQHKIARLHIIREPAPREGKFPESVPVERTIAFTYEDGPRDVEAVAVDAAAGEILLVSKRDAPPRIYTLPLRPRGSKLVARKIGTVPTIPPPNLLEQKFDPYGPQPTSMSIAPDGSALALLTYKAAYLYRRNSGENWVDALARDPERLPIPRLPQAEGIAFSRDGRSIFVISEGKPAPLIRLDLAN